jgi:hypothetical protein
LLENHYFQGEYLDLEGRYTRSVIREGASEEHNRLLESFSRERMMWGNVPIVGSPNELTKEEFDYRTKLEYFNSRADRRDELGFAGSSASKHPAEQG